MPRMTEGWHAGKPWVRLHAAHHCPPLPSAPATVPGLGGHA